MKKVSQSIFTVMIILGIIALSVPAFAETLSSWNEGPAKKSIVQFVKDVSTTGSPKFVPQAERIAVFDNDGTLWVNRPLMLLR
jgi:acid phosphatase class B